MWLGVGHTIDNSLSDRWWGSLGHLPGGLSEREARPVFEIGEGVMHPVHGAGVISDITFESLCGQSCEYHVRVSCD